MSEQQNDQVTTEEQPKLPEGTVTKAQLDRALADLHKYKSQAKDYEAKVKTLEESTLREKEDYKALAERYKADADSANDKYQRTVDSAIAKEKHVAVREAALKLGMRPEAMGDLDLFNLDGVVIETTSTGRMNVLGAEAFIQNLKSSRPYMFGQSTPTNVNSRVPGVVTESVKSVNESDLIKLQAQARKSGDWTPYQAALNQFRGQKKK